MAELRASRIHLDEIGQSSSLVDQKIQPAKSTELHSGPSSAQPCSSRRCTRNAARVAPWDASTSTGTMERTWPLRSRRHGNSSPPLDQLLDADRRLRLLALGFITTLNSGQSNDTCNRQGNRSVAKTWVKHPSPVPLIGRSQFTRRHRFRPFSLRLRFCLLQTSDESPLQR